MKICFCHPVLNEYGNCKTSFFEVLAHSLSVSAKLLAVRREIDFVDLTYTAARRDVIESQLRDNPAIGVFLFAGQADANGLQATGQNKEVCLDAQNAHYLAGKKVYLICCSTGNHLARQIVNAGAEFCLGFTDKVYLMARKQEPVVVRCLIEGLISMLDCDEPGSVHRRVIAKHTDWVRRIMRKYGDEEEWLLAAAAIDWNMEHFAVVTKESSVKGVSILTKMGNRPGNLSTGDLDAAIRRMESWVQERGDVAEGPGLVTGNSEDLSPAEILRILKERREKNDWGHDDLPERYLVLLARK